jgi:hypothetical protein
MQQELCTIFGVLAVAVVVVFMGMLLLKRRREGMTGGVDSSGGTNNSGNSGTNSSSNGSSKSNGSGGEAGLASAYAAGLKAQVVKLQDELLISKYRKEYESVLINLDDYLGLLMLKQALHVDTSGDVRTNMEAVHRINALKEARDTLNTTMSFLDKQ